MSSSSTGSSSEGSSSSTVNKSLIRSSLIEYLTDPQLSQELKTRLLEQAKTKPQVLLVLVLHFLMLKHGFRCVGLLETDANVEMEEGIILPPNGFDQNTEMFSLKYKHSQRTFTFSLKVLMMGPSKLLIFATTLLFPHLDINDNSNINMSQYAQQQEKEQVYQLELNNINEYIDREKLSSSNTEVVDVLKNVQNLENQFRNQVLNKLVPKEGFEAGGSVNISTSSSSTQQQPSRILPEHAFDEDYDPLRIGQPRRPQGFFQPPPGFGGGVGDEDLYPGIGGYPVPRPFRSGGSGGMPFGGGGNLVGPNNPMFGGPRRPQIGGIPFPGSFVPPGARFDPIYPNAPMGPGPNRGQPPNTGGEPTPDHQRVPRDMDDDEDYSHFYM